jgi:hypothetical protein
VIHQHNLAVHRCPELGFETAHPDDDEQVRPGACKLGQHCLQGARKWSIAACMSSALVVTADAAAHGMLQLQSLLPAPTTLADSQPQSTDASSECALMKARSMGSIGGHFRPSSGKGTLLSLQMNTTRQMRSARQQSQLRWQCRKLTTAWCFGPMQWMHAQCICLL